MVTVLHGWLPLLSTFRVVDAWLENAVIPKTPEDAFERYCSSERGAVARPRWLTDLLIQVSQKVASQWEVGSDGNVARNQRQSVCYWQLAAWMRRRRLAQARTAGHSSTDPAAITVCEVSWQRFELGAFRTALPNLGAQQSATAKAPRSMSCAAGGLQCRAFGSRIPVCAQPLSRALLWL